MNLTTRLKQLEEAAAAADAGRYLASRMSEDLLARALEPNFEWLGIVMPPRPWTAEARRAIDRFWDGSYGLGEDCGPDGRDPWFTVYGYSVFQFWYRCETWRKSAGLPRATFTRPVVTRTGLSTAWTWGPTAGMSG